MKCKNEEELIAGFKTAAIDRNVWSSQFRTVSFSSINTDLSNPRSPSKRK